MRISKTATLIGLILVIGLIGGCQEEKTDPKTSLTEPAKTESTIKAEPETTDLQTPQKSGQKPKIKVVKTVHDFGKVDTSSKHTCTFTFENIGNAPLKVNTKSTCSCTIPALKKKIYEPGESGEIKVTYTAPKVPLRPEKKGVDSRTVRLLSNDPTNPSVALTLKASVRFPVTATPMNQKLSLVEENVGLKPIKIACDDGVEFAITSLTSTGKAISVQFDQNVKATEFILEPVVDMNLFKGKNLNGKISIVTSHPKGKLATVYYETPPMFAVNNQRLTAMNAKAGETIIRKNVSIISNYDQKAEIVSSKSTKGFIEIVNQKKVGNNINLEIKITPPVQKRKFFFDMLEITLESGDVLKITLTGKLESTE